MEVLLSVLTLSLTASLAGDCGAVGTPFVPGILLFMLRILGVVELTALKAVKSEHSDDVQRSLSTVTITLLPVDSDGESGSAGEEVPLPSRPATLGAVRNDDAEGLNMLGLLAIA
jgi:hypothetical protein